MPTQTGFRPPGSLLYSACQPSESAVVVQAARRVITVPAQFSIAEIRGRYSRLCVVARSRLNIKISLESLSLDIPYFQAAGTIS